MQLSHDARRTPSRVGSPHVLDQRTYFFGESRTARLAALTASSPVSTAALLLPGDDGTRLHEFQGLLPTGPQAGEPNPEPAIRWLKFGSRDALLIDCNLMSQGDEFHLHGEMRAEPCYEGCEQDQDDAWHDRRPHHER